MQKAPLEATKFVRALSTWKEADFCLLHTRAWTQGDPHKDNGNNHPITTGHITGVHNGWLLNEQWLWREMGIADRQLAEVDSEVIFAALAYGQEDFNAGTDKGYAPRLPGADSYVNEDSPHDPRGILEQIEGNAAIAWTDNTYDPARTMHVARLNSSPLWVAQTKAGSFLFASEKQVITDAVSRCGLSDLDDLVEVEEGTYMTVNSGTITSWLGFEPAEDYYSYGGTSTSLSKYLRNKNNKWWNHDDDDYESWADTNRLVVENELTRDDEYTHGDLDSELLGSAKPMRYDITFFDVDYRDRLIEVEDFYSTMKMDPGAEAEHRHLWGADLTPGRWVATTVMGKECWGEVYVMPLSYPDGEYVLRMRVPPVNGSNNGPMDVIFVKRTMEQMWRTNLTTARALPKASTTKEDALASF